MSTPRKIQTGSRSSLLDQIQAHEAKVVAISEKAHATATRQAEQANDLRRRAMKAMPIAKGLMMWWAGRLTSKSRATFATLAASRRLLKQAANLTGEGGHRSARRALDREAK